MSAINKRANALNAITVIEKDPLLHQTEVPSIADPQVKPKKSYSTRRSFATAYKLRILSVYDGCETAAAKGALLRQEGLYHTRIACWKRQLAAASTEGPKKKSAVRTMYRLLEARGETQDRRSQRSHRDAIKPELIATAPNTVWSWDITKLRTNRKWTYFYLYVILDIYSRYVVGWLIADCESKDLARQLIQATTEKQGIQPQTLTLHSDNGPSMTSHTVSQLLEQLSITKTHNRPYTSDDNPFSESQFKTLKYCPDFSGQFIDIQAGEQSCQTFFSWYNTEHYHSGLKWLTPESVHYGHAEEILEKRYQTMLLAYQKNPVRFNHKIPKKKQLAAAVYINPPQDTENLIERKEETTIEIKIKTGQRECSLAA